MPISPEDIPSLVSALRAGTEHITAMAKKMEARWEPEGDDPRRLHNMFARNLITCYASKLSDLSNGVLHGMEQSNFLVYALCGRALIEITATLRYYIHEQYKPLLDKGNLSHDDMVRLIEIDDRHLRGSRFDWQSFLLRNYRKLREDAVADLAAKQKGGAKPASSGGGLQPQVNVQTCMEKWGKELPEVLIAYNLFCDLVHPNIGSTFLVASTSEDGLYFSRFRGSPVGRPIFEKSVALLISVTHKPMGDLLTFLMGTIWTEEELGAEVQEAPEK